MRLISWNMARAIPPKGQTTDPWEVLRSLEPDIALLQECRPAKAGIQGHLHHAPTPRGWGTAVWSRFPLFDLCGLPTAAGCSWDLYKLALDGHVAAAIVQLPGDSTLSATSVHSYPAPVPQDALSGFDVGTIRLPSAKDVWAADLIWWALRGLPAQGSLAVVGGDWNTARRFDEVYGPRGNQEWFDRMAACGWQEVARRFHPEEVQTYFKSGKGPYQLDHVFATQLVAATTTRFEVVSNKAVLGASDHAALVMDWT